VNRRGQRRQPLPEGLRPGERDFFRELRRVVDAAGLTYRELERKTSSVRAGAADSSFYSKSQWARWLNGQAMPPRRAVRRLAEVVTADDLTANHLLRLWDQAAILAQRDGPVPATTEPAGAPPLQVPPGANKVPPDGDKPPRQVPSVTPHFTGRATELAMLDELAGQVTGGSGTGVVVITGTAGVGKTTLANYFCQRMAARFPDGQLHVNLRGFDPGGQPLDASAALRGFLGALGEKGASVPADVDAQAALYRTLVADASLLIVLDNARDVGQVRQLIPGSPGSLVVVTSRNELFGLIAQGAQILTLTPFSRDDAQRFLARRLGADRVEREPEAVAELIRLCAGLPLAMSVAAAHAVARPGFPLPALADELRSRGLDQLDTGDQETSARTVFSWSYHYLSDPGKRMFRLLGVHPGPDTSVLAAASLAGMATGPAHVALRELARAHLVQERAPGRFALHDLLRAYAAELAVAVDGTDSLREAELRLLDHYLHTGYAAALLLVPATDFGDLGPPAAGVVVDPPGTAEAAMAWFAGESLPLLAACARAAVRGLAAHSWQLPWAVAPYLIAQGRWADSAATLRAALTVAERIGDRRGQGHVHYHLAHALDIAGDSEAAAAHLRQSLDAFTATGDRPGQALALYGLASALRVQNRHAEALPVAREALRLRAEHGTPAAAATTENLLGSICARLGLHAEAIEHCQRALRISEEAGLRLYRGDALYCLGLAHFGAGDHATAASRYEQAAEAYREIGAMPDLATTLFLLAVTRKAAGDTAAAQRSRAAAGAILDAMPSSDAERVRSWIRLEADPPPAAVRAPDPCPPADL
jgi:tetratricopeptide (TPR) repeat protein/transcriptional regulator with XRE-family HTH domain